MNRIWAIVERELRRLRRRPALMVASMVFPLVQLIALGSAFGGNLRGLRVAMVDQDGGLPAVRLRAMAGAVAAGPRTFETLSYADGAQALADLRDGRVNGVLIIPPGLSRRVINHNAPRAVLVQDNTDSFVASVVYDRFTALAEAYGSPATRAAREDGRLSIDPVEIYPYVSYMQYLLPGAIVMSIFMMVAIGGGLIYVDDKAKGLHEGYLVTPVSRFELIAGFALSGAIKAILAGIVLVIAGSLVAGIPHPLDPGRLLRLLVLVVVIAMAQVCMMALLVARVDDPLLPRATIGLLDTLLYFPSGAVYPPQGFPPWLRAISRVDPFTYAVHALKCVLLKDTGIGALWGDLAYLVLFSALSLLAATVLFRRTL